jgi:hypothetical protein
MSLSLLLWQALYELLKHAIELQRIVDEQCVSILVGKNAKDVKDPRVCRSRTLGEKWN